VVLLVEHNLDSLAMHAIGLLSMGLQPVTADNAADGFSRACRLHPEVIVVDMTLSDLSGLELARRLRDDIRTRSSSIIFTSDDTSPETARQAREAGGDHFIVTPCQPARLAQEIATVIRARQPISVASSGARRM
jgi:two-component system phosphate regulon response regulator PhoB